MIERLEDEIDQLKGELDAAQSAAGNQKSVNSLLLDISDRSHQMFEKEEQLIDLQVNYKYTNWFTKLRLL